MNRYTLGATDPELARLDLQADWLAGPTRILLQTAGLRPGQRVLDLGSGLGHVARQCADLVDGAEVVGLDSAERLVEVATGRTGPDEPLRFVVGDVRTWRDEEPFDVVVGRLILFHLPDAVEVVRHHLAGLRPGGLVVALDFDLGAIRTEPAVPLVTECAGLLLDGFRSAGADPTIGTALAGLLRTAGVQDVQTLGLQDYLPADDPRGPGMLAGVVASLSGHLFATGLTTPEKLDLATLADRIGAQTRAAGATVVPPTLVAAWGRIPS